MQAAPGELRLRSWQSSRSLALELLEIAVLALGIYLVITFAVETVHVIGSSMYPNFSTDDYLIASKLDYRFHPPQRGDVVILRNPFGDKDLIKRVVGLPGDRLLIRDGKVYINGRALDEPYTSPEPWTVMANYPDAQEPDGMRIQSGYLFVMGDNRNHSSDSREFGPIRATDIEAKAWLRIWPLGKFGFVNGQHPTLETALLSLEELVSAA